jgi:hypothetical protein
MAGILCSGDVYFDRLNDDGKSTGLVQVGNATALSITESSTLKERMSKRNATYGQVLDSVAIKGAAKVGLTLDELNKPNLALVLLGEAAAKAIAAAASKTKEFDLSAVVDGVFYEIGDLDITVSGVTVGGTAMAAGTYAIEPEAGFIKFTETAPATGTAIVTYAVAASTGYVIDGSAKPTIKGRLLMIGKNLADSSRIHLDILEAVLTPKSGLDFLASDFASAQFEGTLNTPAGASSPYTVTVLAKAA